MPPTFATITDTGRVRRSNEDALFARPPVFMIADGMGGPQGGEVASAVTAKAFEWYCPQDENAEAELTRLIEKVNGNIFELAASEGRPGMGTTVTAALLREGAVILAHVGDSRAYLWRGGELRQLTQDHSLVAEMVRNGTLTPEEAHDHPQRSVITRALGVDETVEVDTQVFSWEPGDIFLLCSDGLTSMLTDDIIAAVLASAENLETAARTLAGKANDRGGHDNISVVLFCPDGSVPGVKAGDADTGVIRLPDGAASELAASIAPEGEGGLDPPRDGEGKPSWRRAFRWLFKSTPGLVLVGILATLVVLGSAWLGTREVYFLGVDNGYVAVFRGVPYSLGPVNLFSVDMKSPLKLNDLAQFEQDQIARQELHSGGGARAILNNYMAEVSKQKEQAAQAAQNASTTGTNPSALPDGTLPGGSLAGPDLGAAR